MTTRRYASISIDLDSLVCYQRIYGLPQTPDDTRLYTKGLRRFLNICAKAGIRATLFTVGEDILVAENRDLLEEAVAAGHEIANHTWSHDYRITLQDADSITAELQRAKEGLEKALHTEVVGFRAPGYNINRNLANAIHRSGHLYDTSLFPSVPYYLTRAAAIAALKAKGTPSKSLVGDPRMMSCPLGPYRADTDAPWKKARKGAPWFIEAPITVTNLPFGRFPLLGSFLLLLGETGWKALHTALRISRRPLIFEFHAMDFMDGIADDLPPELLVQPDVKIPLDKKLSLIENMIQSITRDYTVEPMKDITRQY